MTAPLQPPLSGYDERWREHNTERRALILRAAAQLVEQAPSGADISVQQIADRAGVAKSVMYRQFKGKEDLERTLRRFVLDELTAELEADLDISTGSLKAILSRTITTAAGWMSEHPRLVELLRAGPTDDTTAPDAMAELKQRIVVRSLDTIDAIAAAVGADSHTFTTIPFVVVTMVEATLTSWIREETAMTIRSRDEIVEALTDITWFVLDGASRAIGFNVDPDQELTAVIDALSRTHAP